MAFLDKTGLQALTNRLVQGDAIKVASHRGRTIENVIDNITRECTNVPTPLEYKIENRVTDFRIGQGRDVDASGDVEKGYTEVELQGKTWQNLKKGEAYNYTQCGSSTQNGEYRTITEIQEGTPGANILVGLKNPFPLLKPSTKYTMFFREVPSSSRWIIIRESSANQNVFSGDFDPKNNSVSFTTTANYSGEVTVYYNELKISDKVRTSNNIVLIEGDHTQTPVEELPQYFEGIKSSFEDGVVDIDVVGKNLFEPPSENVVYESKSGLVYSMSSKGVYKLNGTSSTSGGRLNLLNRIPFIKLQKGKTYVISSRLIGGDMEVAKFGGFFLSKKEGSSVLVDWGVDNSKTFKVTEDIEVVFGSNSYTGDKYNNCEFIIQLEEASSSTPYEPYYKKKISFNIDEPLRSLPNGICDEIVGDKYIQRVGVATFVGGSNETWRDSWQPSPPKELYMNFYMTHNDFKNLGNKSPIRTLGESMLCNTFADSVNGTSVWTLNAQKICFHNSTDEQFLQVCLQRDSLSTQDSAGFKKWLSQNPTTIYYELAEPIITPVEPIKFETQPLSSIEINSEISPTSFHTVQLNRAAQIERGITEIAELKNRVEILETMYDSHFLETAHKLELLGMDYELESEEF